MTIKTPQKDPNGEERTPATIYFWTHITFVLDHTFPPMLSLTQPCDCPRSDQGKPVYSEPIPLPVFPMGPPVLSYSVLFPLINDITPDKRCQINGITGDLALVTRSDSPSGQSQVFTVKVLSTPNASNYHNPSMWDESMCGGTPTASI